MKGTRMLLPVLLSLLVLLVMGGCAKGKYTPKPNEEFYGTWINDKSTNAGLIQKKVSTPQGNQDYYDISDKAPVFEDEQQIDAKWTDSEGNIWYKIFGTIVAGANKGTKWQELDKLSKSATVWEYVFVTVRDFDPKLYPTKIDPSSDSYRIFYRAAN